jgi:protein-L-isoaspartate(D-aspartate) O-methyltransferase
VMSRIAAEGIAIERKPELVAVATERMQRLRYDNVRIVEGDGTRGCPDHAPFDAILAAASGSHVPQPLIDQLVAGGRLVMPVGSQAWAQQLVKITKHADGRTEREDLGGVRFVPLIGEEGFEDAGRRA